MFFFTLPADFKSRVTQKQDGMPANLQLHMGQCLWSWICDNPELNIFIKQFNHDVCGARELWFEYLYTERRGREALSMYASGFGAYGYIHICR